MARITRKNDDLLKEYKRYKKEFVLCVITFLIMGFLLSSLEPISSIVCVICIILMSKNWKNMEILKSGLAGEEVTAEIISSLPDSFYAFQNVKVTYEDKTSELDMIVVGPTGVFVIETKNMTGTIIGDYESQEWVHKKQVNGRTTSKNFYSPVKQVGTHVYRLANYLRSNGWPVHVASLVFFANQDADVQVSGKPTQTLVIEKRMFGRELLYGCIAEGDYVFSDEMVNQICGLINNLH